jgi:hypothetical protein
MADAGASALLRQTLSEVQEHIQLDWLQSEALDRTAQHIATIEERLRVLEKSNANVRKQTGMGLIALTAMREAIRREALHVYGAAASAMDHPRETLVHGLGPCMPPSPLPALARTSANTRGGSAPPPAARAAADCPVGPPPRHLQGVLRIGAGGDEPAPAAGTKRPCADPSVGQPRPPGDRLAAPEGPARQIPGGSHAAGEVLGGGCVVEAGANAPGRAPYDAGLTRWYEGLNPARRGCHQEGDPARDVAGDLAPTAQSPPDLPPLAAWAPRISGLAPSCHHSLPPSNHLASACLCHAATAHAEQPSSDCVSGGAGRLPPDTLLPLRPPGFAPCLQPPDAPPLLRRAFSLAQPAGRYDTPPSPPKRY